MSGSGVADCGTLVDIVGNNWSVTWSKLILGSKAFDLSPESTICTATDGSMSSESFSSQKYLRVMDLSLIFPAYRS